MPSSSSSGERTRELVNNEKRVAWFSIPIHAQVSVPIKMLLRLVTHRVALAPLTLLYKLTKHSGSRDKHFTASKWCYVILG